jgi:hypothetical protein
MESIKSVFLGVVFFTALIVGFSVALYNRFSNKTIESTHRIEPTIKLTTDGTKIDTIFIYKK